MRDEDLTTLLRSPSLALEPPPDLVAVARAGARRVRRRRTAGVAALSALALVGAGLVGPGLLDQRRDRLPDPVAEQLAARFPQATTAVEVLERLNGGEVVTFFSGTRWCTASTRTLVNDGCRGYVADDPVAPFALHLEPGDTTLRVDRETLTAGVLGTGVERVAVELTDGRVLRASAVSGRGFPRPVWWARVPPGAVVRAYTAYDPAGDVVSTLQVSRDAFSVEAEPAD